MIEKKEIPNKSHILEYITVNSENKPKKERMLFDSENLQVMKAKIKEYKKSGKMSFATFNEGKLTWTIIEPVAITVYRVLEYYTKVNESE